MASLEKAKIVKVDENGNEMGGGFLKGYIICMYNPTEVQYSRSAKWQKTQKRKESDPQYDYEGSEGAKISVDLLFDTTMSVSGSGYSIQAGQDVRDFTKFIVELMQVDKDAEERPPFCRFQWGQKFYFVKGIVTDASFTYTLFLPSGVPVRAKAKVTFQEIISEGDMDNDKWQNPTSRSEARKIWTVREGERLDWIAYQEYGDSKYWRHIAETNSLDDPHNLRPGQILKLTPLP